MSKNKEMPKCVKIEGRLYRRVVFLVKSLKIDGTANECQRVGEKETVKLKGGECFMTGYIAAENLSNEDQIPRDLET